MSYYNETTQSFLSGQQFHNDLKIHYPIKKSIKHTREQFLVKYSIKKKIIHVGFVDHIPLIEHKIKKNQWLHKQLHEVADKLAGIDINLEGIDFLKQNYSYGSLYHYDISGNQELPKELTSQKWDCIMLPDIVEHVENPYFFLRAIHSKFIGNTERMVICVPNALSYKNFFRALRKNEFINSDHRFVFTPYTLSKILTESGFEVLDIQVLERMSYGGRNFFKRAIKYFLPLMRDNLIVECAFKK